MNMTPSITTDLVRNLIAHQFPQWADLSITPVAIGGHDNRTFHLGNQMSVRLPSAQCYAAKIEKEFRWLPVLASQIATPISQPIALGKPTASYPWQWGIYRWFNGQSFNIIDHHKIDMSGLARDLAKFLRELQAVTVSPEAHELLPGFHNFYRGAHPSVYEQETLDTIQKLNSLIDVDAALAVWNAACATPCTAVPVWIHGDMAAGNILIQDGKLAAVIDFGGMGIGYPACDLVVAWTLFTGESREIFMNEFEIDAEVWKRARAWALWKALITLRDISDRTSKQAALQLRSIHEIHNSEL